MQPCTGVSSYASTVYRYLFYVQRGENFTPVRNLATVSYKRETTKRFGVKSVCRLSSGKTGTGSAYVTFAILNHSCILLT